jgi:hypothetical protein
MAFPEPSKIRPNMSSETPSFRLWPVNSTLVFLTSIPVVPSKTYVVVRLRHDGRQQNDVPEQRRGFLAWILVLSLLHKMVSLTSSFQNLTRALGAIGQRQRHDFVVSGELDLSTIHISLRDIDFDHLRQRTLSRTTNGPLMPPMVLYLILGWTDIMRGSITSGMMAVVSASCRTEVTRQGGCSSAAEGAYMWTGGGWRR